MLLESCNVATAALRRGVFGCPTVPFFQEREQGSAHRQGVPERQVTPSRLQCQGFPRKIMGLKEAFQAVFARKAQEVAAKEDEDSTTTGKVVRMRVWMPQSKVRFFSRGRPMRQGVVGWDYTFRIENQLIMDILARTFEPISRDAHTMTERATTLLSQLSYSSTLHEDKLTEAERAVEEHEIKLNRYLDNQIKRAEQQVLSAGYRLDDITHSYTSYEATITSLFAKDYIDLYVKADRLYTLHNFLWSSGNLSDNTQEANRKRKSFIRELKTQLHAYAASITRSAGTIQRLIDQVREERKAYRAAQSRRDKNLEHGAEYEALSRTEEGNAAARDRARLKEQLPEIVARLDEEDEDDDDVRDEDEADD